MNDYTNTNEVMEETMESTENTTTENEVFEEPTFTEQESQEETEETTTDDEQESDEAEDKPNIALIVALGGLAVAAAAGVAYGALTVGHNMLEKHKAKKEEKKRQKAAKPKKHLKVRNPFYMEEEPAPEQADVKPDQSPLDKKIEESGPEIVKKEEETKNEETQE